MRAFPSRIGHIGVRAGAVSAIACLAAWLCGCASTIAPLGYLDTPAETQRQAFGSWARIQTQESNFELPEGELIAVDADSLFLLDAQGAMRGMAAAEVKMVHIQAYDSKKGTVALWAAAGAVTTISHGFIMLLSLPAWILVGTISSSAQAATPHEYLHPGQWNELAKFARFPQGMPAGLDRAHLHPKPIRH